MEKYCWKQEVEKDCFTSEYKNNFIVGECVDDTFFILVSDTGVGVSHDSISSVFDRFYKVNTVNTDSHLGTGIGLALVKSLVLLHKGSISIFSERGRGTDMVVRLPLDSGMFNESDFIRHQETRAEEIIRTDSEEMATSVEMKGMEDELLHSTKKKILIIEDNEDLRMLIAESLSDEFQVMQAGDGVESLKLIEHTDFDLIISDIMMPNKDGISLCNDIKGDMNTSHIPVILLTAKTSLESKIEGVDSGADLYFEKPVDLTYLKLSIQNIFRNRRQLKEHYAKNYYADSCELSSNEQDNKFLKQFIAFIEANMDQSEMDINQIAGELSMSRSKLYTKVKSLTGKSVVEWSHPDYRYDIKSKDDEVAFCAFLEFTDNQLKELATRYPTVKDFWFDGTWDASIKKKWLVDSSCRTNVERPVTGRNYQQSTTCR